MNTITLNGVSSATITGLLIQELPPVSKPLIRTQIETIDGRDGDIITSLGYSAYDRTARIGLRYNFDIDNVIKFFNSEGTAIFSNEPNKLYTYKIIEQIDFNRLVRFREADVVFHVQPYKYLSNESPIDYETTYINDSEPYLFRKSLDGIGSKEIDEIVGGTVAWNQLVPINTNDGSVLGVTITSNDDGTYILNGTATGVTANYWFDVGSYSGKSMSVNGHKYFIHDVLLFQQEGLTSKGHAPIGTYKIYATDFSGAFRFRMPNFTNGNAYANVKVTPQVIDITQLFGSTIADYIYSLEQSHTGDGVAFFRKFFNKPYYAYNSGELISSLPTAHETVGFNQWDEEWEAGGINTTTGAPIGSGLGIRPKNYIPILPNQAYYIKAPANLYPFFYDADFNYIGFFGNGWTNRERIPSELTNSLSGGGSFANARYMRFRCDCGQTYANDICINFSSSRNGEYEPYVKHTYPISSVQMHGIWKLDANNKIYCDGDIRKADGTLERRYGIVDLGSLTWVNNGAITGGVQYACNNLNKAVGETNFICSAYATHTPTLEIGYISGRATTKALIINSTITNLSDFVASLNGVYLVYELATPTTETVDTFTNPQEVSVYGTEEYVDTRSVPIPVGHNTSYPSDTVIEVTNGGNVIARPTITIYGEGTIGVYLNGNQMFTINMGDAEYITIDTEAMNAYAGGLLMNRRVTGDYNQFFLPIGTSTISMTGVVSSVSIENYSRWV